MKKRFAALILAVLMLAPVLTGCGGTPAPITSAPGEPSAAGGDAKGEAYTVTMMFIGNTQDDEAKVETAINELTMRDLNMKLDVLVVPWATAAEQIRLMLSGGEKLDLMMAMSSSAASYVATKSVYDISGYIDEYGENIKEYMGDDAKIANLNGYVYGIPNTCDWYRQTSLMVRTEWMEEAGFKKEDIKSREDIEKMYAAVQAKHPEASMLAMKNQQTFDSDWRTSDPLSDGWGVLLNQGEKPEVVNWFASDEYRAFLDRQYAWAQKGWISKDAATTTDTCDSMIGAGKAFSQVSTNHPSMETEASLNIGVPITIIPQYEAYTTTTYTNAFFWSVARNSKEPEKAFQMLDYIYGSPEAANLLNWGIEGEHYVIAEDGHATFPEGLDKATDKYNAQFAYMLPNQFITRIWEGAPLDVHAGIEKMNKTAKRSCAYGFAYDGTAFTNEIAQLTNVKNEYLDALNTGAVNPAEVLPRFLEDLDAAGLQKVIAAKQQQLDAWMK